MSVLRPFRTRVDPIARDDPWSTTQLPAGVTEPFDMRDPSGPTVVAILPATSEIVGSANFDQTPPQLYLPGHSRSVSRLDHVSPLPTIVLIDTGSETSRRNTTGTLRIWMSASADLQNGAWCEIERAADRDDDPDNFLRDTPQFFVATADFSFDDGGADDLPVLSQRPGFPMLGGFANTPGGGGQRAIHRIVRLRYGYTQDGVDVAVASYRALTTRPDDMVVEIAVTPFGHVADESSVRPVSVVFITRDYPASVFCFDCPGDALSHAGNEMLEPINAIQWTHGPSVVVNELFDPQVSALPQFTATTHPIPIDRCFLGTALHGNITSTVPRVEGAAATLNHQKFQFFTSQGNTTSQGFINTPQQGRVDVSDRTGFAVKSGPWWHERAIVSPGTAAAVVGARHRLTITMPSWNEGLPAPIVSYGSSFSPPTRGIFIASTDALYRRSLQGQQLVCDPSIEGEQLLQQCYTGAAILPLIDTQNPGPHDPAVPLADFTLLPHAQWFVRTEVLSQQQAVTWPGDDPWQSQDSAADAGISADDWNFYRRRWSGATIPTQSFALSPNGVVVFVDLIMTYQWTITRLEPTGINTIVTGSAVKHFADGFSVLFYLTDAQCVALANGETLDVPQYGGLPQFGGTPTGYTAAMSLSVLS